MYVYTAANAANSGSSKQQKHELALQIQVQQRLQMNKRLAAGKLTDLGRMLSLFPIK
jgi:hypothetical protein